MHLSPDEIEGLGIALNEASLLGAEVDTRNERAGLTFSVLTLPESGDAPSDPRISMVLAPVRRVAAVLLERCSPGLRSRDDRKAVVTPVAVPDLLSVVQSFGGCPIYGWEFVDTEADWETVWAERLSLDWRGSGAHGAHTLTVFQDSSTRFLEVRFWFDDLQLLDPAGRPVPLPDFIAGGRRWWDGFYAGDPRTKGSGMFPLTPPKS